MVIHWHCTGTEVVLLWFCPALALRWHGSGTCIASMQSTSMVSAHYAHKASTITLQPKRSALPIHRHDNTDHCSDSSTGSQFRSETSQDLGSRLRAALEGTPDRLPIKALGAERWRFPNQKWGCDRIKQTSRKRMSGGGPARRALHCHAFARRTT